MNGETDAAMNGETNPKEIGLSDLPDDLLWSVVSRLSVRQAHRLKLDRRLRSFVDRFAGLEQVVRGDHPLLEETVREEGCSTIVTRRWEDAEGRAWGPFERTIAAGSFLTSGSYVDDRIHGLKTTEYLLSHGKTQRRALYELGEMIKESEVGMGEVRIVTKKRTVTGRTWGRFDLSEEKLIISWDVEVDEDGHVLYRTTLQLPWSSLTVEWGRRVRFKFYFPFGAAVSVDGNAVRSSFVNEGFDVEVDGVSSNPPQNYPAWWEDVCGAVRLDVAVSRDGRRLAVFSVDPERMMMGFELDGWHETTYERER